METSMYLCSSCGRIFKLKGSNKRVKCTHCDHVLLIDMHISLEDWQNAGKEDRARRIRRYKRGPEDENRPEAEKKPATETPVNAQAAETSPEVPVNSEVPVTAQAPETTAGVPVTTETKETPTEAPGDTPAQETTHEVSVNSEVPVTAQPSETAAEPEAAEAGAAEGKKEEAKSETDAFDFSFEEESESDLLEFGFGTNNNTGTSNTDGASAGSKQFEFEFEEDESGLFDFVPEDSTPSDAPPASTTEPVSETVSTEPSSEPAAVETVTTEPTTVEAVAAESATIEAVAAEPVPEPEDPEESVEEDISEVPVRGNAIKPDPSEYEEKLAEHNADNDLFYFGDGDTEDSTAVEETYISAMQEETVENGTLAISEETAFDEAPVVQDEAAYDEAPAVIEETSAVQDEAAYDEAPDVTEETSEIEASAVQDEAAYDEAPAVTDETDEDNAPAAKFSVELTGDANIDIPVETDTRAETTKTETEIKTEEIPSYIPKEPEESTSYAEETDKAVTEMEQRVRAEENNQKTEPEKTGESLFNKGSKNHKESAEDKDKSKGTTVVNEYHYENQTGSIFMKRLFSCIGIISGLIILALGAFALKLQNDALSISSIAILFAMCMGGAILSYFGCKLGETME